MGKVIAVVLVLILVVVGVGVGAYLYDASVRQNQAEQMGRDKLGRDR